MLSRKEVIAEMRKAIQPKIDTRRKFIERISGEKAPDWLFTTTVSYSDKRKSHRRCKMYNTSRVVFVEVRNWLKDNYPMVTVERVEESGWRKLNSTVIRFPYDVFGA